MEEDPLKAAGMAVAAPGTWPTATEPGMRAPSARTLAW